MTEQLVRLRPAARLRRLVGTARRDQWTSVDRRQHGGRVAFDTALGTAHLHFERRGSVAWCIVDRPEARNVLTPAMYAGLALAVERADAAPDVRALVITGTADVFVPGGEMTAEVRSPDAVPAIFSALRRARVPIVAAVNGICQASGLLIAMLADIAVASDRATFRAPELLHGFPDMWCASVLPAHVGVGRARELMMTGRLVAADEALRIGLVERVVGHDSLETAARGAVMDLLASAPRARLLWKRAADAHYAPVDERTQENAVSSPEVQEGFQAFLERRPPAWRSAPDAADLDA